MIELADLFQRASQSYRDGRGPFHGEGAEAWQTAYDEFVTSLHAAPGAKLRADLPRSDLLSAIPPIAILLADAVVVTGVGEDTGAEIIIPEMGGATLQIEGASFGPETTVVPGFLQFPRSRILEWIDEAWPFIERGQLVYVPRRVLAWADKVEPDGPTHWKVDMLDDAVPWDVWRVVPDAGDDQSTMPLLAATGGGVSNDIELVSYGLPFITGLDLGTLDKVYRDEGDTFLAFRKELAKLLSEIRAHSDDDPSELRRAANEMRRDIVDPAIETLERKTRAIVQQRSLRIVGAGAASILVPK